MAGTGDYGYTGDGGPASEATFMSLSDVAMAPGGGYYLADSNACVIRRVLPDATITTVAGAGTCWYSGNTPTEGRISPMELAVAPDGDVFFSERCPQGDRVRRLAPDGTISTVVGDAGSDPFCTGLTGVSGMAVTPDGTLYLNYMYSGIWRVESDGSLTRIYAAEDSATGWTFGLAAAADGHLYVGVVFEMGTAPAVSGFREVDPATGTASAFVPNFHSETTGNGLAADPDGFVYVTMTSTAWPEVSANQVYRWRGDVGWSVLAGSGDPDPVTAIPPAGGTQLGNGLTLDLSPGAIEVTPNGGLLVISGGLVVYRIER